MRVLVSGSTGFIGSALVRALADAGHEPVRLVRTNRPDDFPSIVWDPANESIADHALDDIDAVVHLAGESIASSRWTDAQKARIMDSRVKGTRTLANAMARCDTPPSVFLSGSAIGYYGETTEPVDETGPAADDFAAQVSVTWEAAAAPIAETGSRLALLRTGIVYDPSGGALGEQLLFFKLGLGGRIGDGQQWLSWISLADEVGAIIHLLTNDVEGPVNLTAPNPVTNDEFTKALGSVLNRPTLIPIPKLALWARLGRELSETLLERGANVTPSVLLSSGYEFSDPELRPALERMLNQ